MDNLSKQELASSYGFAMAFLQSNDELWGLFNQAVKETWDPNRFIAKLRDTKWFQKHSASVRNAILQETSDPATYQANVDQMYSTVRDAWGSMFGTANMSDKQLRTWAETAHRMGWSQAELVDRMTKGINFQKLLKSKSIGGTAAEMDTQIQQLTRAYGVQLGPQWRARQVEKLVKGDDTISGVQKRLLDLAQREYKAFADRLAGGETVEDIAEPYRQRMADLLEMNPADIDLQNKTVQRALKQRTPDGKPAAMDLSDFADMVRRDDRWQYTDNAREEMSGIVANLAQSFGKVG